MWSGLQRRGSYWPWVCTRPELLLLGAEGGGASALHSARLWGCTSLPRGVWSACGQSGDWRIGWSVNLHFAGWAIFKPEAYSRDMGVLDSHLNIELIL